MLLNNIQEKSQSPIVNRKAIQKQCKKMQVGGSNRPPHPLPTLVGLSGAAKLLIVLYIVKKKKKEAKNIKENFLDEKNTKMAKRYHAYQGSQVLIVSNF